MTPEQFCYWLQGFIELHNDKPDEQQWQSVRVHLSTVFNKVTPEVRPNSTLPLSDMPMDYSLYLTPYNPAKPVVIC